MKRIFVFLSLLIGTAGLGWTQGQQLPSAIAKGLFKNPALAVKGATHIRSALPVGTPAWNNYLRAMERDNFSDLDEMLKEYFVLNGRLASANVLRQNREIQEAIIKKWLERDFYASGHTQQVSQGVAVQAVQGKIDYLNYIPYDTRLVMLGEVHEQDWMVNEVERIILQFKKAYPQRNVYYASEFIDAVPGEELFFLTKEKQTEQFVRKRPYYRAVTNRMIAAGVHVMGLEDPQISQELLRIGYVSDFYNTPLAWKTIAPAGMRERNLYWARLIRKIYEQDPDAVVFVHAGFGHTNYNQPETLSVMLKEFNPFVVEYSAAVFGDFNTLLRKHIPIPAEVLQQGRKMLLLRPDQAVFYVRHMFGKRSALVAGCDLHIKKQDQ